jgi:hypothetical protein
VKEALGIIGGTIIAIAGLIAFLASGNEHSLCSGVILYSVVASSACKAATGFYYGGLIAVAIGIFLILATLIASPTKRVR